MARETVVPITRRLGPDMPDIARLDEDGLLVAVETVADDEHGTDLAKRQDRPAGRPRHAAAPQELPLGRSARPLHSEVDGAAGRGRARDAGAGRGLGRGDRGPLREARREATAGEATALPAAIEDEAADRAAGRTKRAIDKFRRVVPRRKPSAITLDQQRAGRGGRGEPRQQSAGAAGAGATDKGNDA